jgi:hypothetical protein
MHNEVHFEHTKETEHHVLPVDIGVNMFTTHAQSSTHERSERQAGRQAGRQADDE